MATLLDIRQLGRPSIDDGSESGSKENAFGFTIANAAAGGVETIDLKGNLYVTGNLFVKGNIDSVSVTQTQLEIVDKVITLASGTTGESLSGAALRFGGSTETDGDLAAVSSITHDHNAGTPQFVVSQQLQVSGAILPEANGTRDLGSGI